MTKSSDERKRRKSLEKKFKDQIDKKGKPMAYVLTTVHVFRQDCDTATIKSTIPMWPDSSQQVLLDDYKELSAAALQASMAQTPSKIVQPKKKELIH